MLELSLDLLDFTYTLGEGEPGGKSLVQDLVIHYTACEVLADDEKFALPDFARQLGVSLTGLQRSFWIGKIRLKFQFL